MTTINKIDIFREVGDLSPHATQWLEARNQLFVVEGPDGKEHTFVENDTPREADVTLDIVANTTGYALFDDEGEYIGSYRSLDRAIAAQAGAKFVVKADVEGAEPDEDILAESPEDI